MNTYMMQYFRYLQTERRLSANSLASYKRDLNRFLCYLKEQGMTEPDHIQKHHISRYLLFLKEQGRKAATISRHIVSLRAFFHYLITNGLIKQDPSIYIEAPKQEKKIPMILTMDTTSTLLDVPNRSLPAGKRDKAMLELLYATGIRVSELVSLNIEHVHMNLGYIQCIGTGMKERIVPFGRMASEALEDYLQSGREALTTERNSEQALFLNHLGTRMTRQGFWKIIKKVAKEAGLEQEITPHTLRHSVAAHLLDNGADVRTVQELLGHADIATTLKYTQVAKVRLKDAYTSSHPRA